MRRLPLCGLFCVTGAMLHRLCQSQCPGPPGGRAKKPPMQEHEKDKKQGTLRSTVMGKLASLCTRTWASRHPRPAAPCCSPLSYPAPGRALAAGKDIRCDSTHVLLCWLQHHAQAYRPVGLKLGALRSELMIAHSGTACVTGSIKWESVLVGALD